MIFLFLVPIFVFQTDANTWQWPIDTEHGLTSSFGEYRALRFHMGLDFSTGGVEGTPVKPAKPGVIFKMRAANNGYGRAIYLRHPDGNITVYAHLARFGPKLEGALKTLGKPALSYFGTLDVQIPVLAEDRIAWTGESGSGLPHFHFEVRDSGNRPIDPLTLEFPSIGSIDLPTRLDGIRFIPLDEDARVNGGRLPFFAGKGIAKVQAKGRIGIQVAAHVQGVRGSRLGCRGVRVYQNGQIIGEWLPRTIDFGDYRKAGLVFDQAHSGFGPTQFAYSFDGRSEYLPALPGYRDEANILVAETMNLKIDLMALNGKWTGYTWELDPSAGSWPADKPVLPIQATTFEVDPIADRIYLHGNGTDGTLQTPKGLIGLSAGEMFVHTAGPGEPPTDLVWRTRAGALKRTVGVLPASANFLYEQDDWRIHGFGPNRLPAQAVVLEPADPKIMPNILAYLSPVLRFGREGLPAKGLSVGYRMEDTEKDGREGLYTWSFIKKRWRYMGNPFKEKRFRIELDHLAPLVMARDISPPIIRKPKFHNYFTGRRMVIPVSDSGSGIDPDSIRVDGPNGPMTGEYDADRRWIIMPEQPGRGPWTVSLSDRAGTAVRQSGLLP